MMLPQSATACLLLPLQRATACYSLLLAIRATGETLTTVCMPLCSWLAKSGDPQGLSEAHMTDMVTASGQTCGHDRKIHV